MLWELEVGRGGWGREREATVFLDAHVELGGTEVVGYYGRSRGVYWDELMGCDVVAATCRNAYYIVLKVEKLASCSTNLFCRGSKVRKDKLWV